MPAVVLNPYKQNYTRVGRIFQLAVDGFSKSASKMNFLTHLSNCFKPYLDYS